MQLLLRRVTERAYSNKDSIVGTWRTRRFKDFLELVKPPSGAKIIDLGGTPYMWELVPHDFEVTLVNLPGTVRPHGYHQIRFIEADATNLKDVFSDQSFDVVFSNSVIEHVGDESKQADFAQEVYRLGKAYWVQTPSDRWPIEPHTGFPFYWQLPEFARQHLKRSWKKKLPVWTEMVEGTRVISRKQMQALFPDGKLYIERAFLLEKSYVIYRPFEQN
ncbi:MAG: class I SAM-dependent methyltransferase [Leptolyngbya sp. IPPAS B-1204]|nr:MAG: class I SAM-dependent methyltransferase [Leptolyngbya sp. IPPAS B-1204]RNJ66547.1 MAG: class I SAM-dependent methyltransferase [Leptolyngbya sp. IPPAS B-1204]